MERLIGGTTAFTGSLPYVVRLAFQTFNQFHSDSQVWSQLECILIHLLTSISKLFLAIQSVCRYCYWSTLDFDISNVLQACWHCYNNIQWLFHFLQWSKSKWNYLFNFSHSSGLRRLSDPNNGHYKNRDSYSMFFQGKVPIIHSCGSWNPDFKHLEPRHHNIWRCPLLESWLGKFIN